ncbi:hypothetical protein BT69DRAFT_334100 [Atractiella rhizophila]|nr:hypothetical protein BT69DRAFT_334100 [Atractiella rhizophila]
MPKCTNRRRASSGLNVERSQRNQDVLVAGGIDWDNVEDDSDIELWAIRLPPKVKPKHLSNLELSVPLDPSSSSSSPIATFKASKTDWNLVSSHQAHEMNQLVPLLPKGDGLSIPSKKISRHLSVQRELPGFPNVEKEDEEPVRLFKPRPKRHVQPDALITHVWEPAGSNTKGVEAPLAMVGVSGGVAKKEKEKRKAGTEEGSRKKIKRE